MDKGPDRNNLADFDALWDYSDPQKTEKTFRELLPAAEAAENACCQLQLLTQIARAEGLQQNFDAAHKTLDEVEQRLEGQTSVVQIRYLLERGRVFNSSKQTDQARSFFLHAWELGRSSAEDGCSIDAAHMMAFVEPPDEALGWIQQALALAEESRDPLARHWLGSLHNNIGWMYHDRGSLEEALSQFRQALAFREEQQQDDEIRIAKWCVARAYRSLGRISEALTLQKSLVDEHQAAGTSDGFVFEELAECYLLLEQPEAAKTNFALAYAELCQDPWFGENESDRISRLKQLAGAQ